MAKNSWLFRAQNIVYSVPIRKQPILKISSLSVEKGKCYFILGENGAGKSSLLSVLGGQLAPNSGDLYWKGIRLKPLSERLVNGFDGIGLVKQEPELNPFLRAEEELYKALRHLPDRQLAQKRKDLVRLCHLKPLLDQKVGNLSGGEKRRLAIALALAQDAELLLLDEPFSDLDYPNKTLFLGMLVELKQKQHTALVLVSHHGEDAYWVADQIHTLEKGRWIEKMERIHSGFSAKSVRTARLLGWRNLMKAGLLPTAKPGFTHFHVPVTDIHFSPGIERIYLGEAEVFSSSFRNEKWHFLLSLNGIWLEMEQHEPIHSFEISIYINTANLLWLKD